MSISPFNEEIQAIIEYMEVTSELDVPLIGQHLRSIDQTLNMKEYQVQLLFHRLMLQDLKNEAIDLLCKCSGGIEGKQVDAVRDALNHDSSKDDGSSDEDNAAKLAAATNPKHPAARRRLDMSSSSDSSPILDGGSDVSKPKAVRRNGDVDDKRTSPKTPISAADKEPPKSPPPIHRRVINWRPILKHFINDNYHPMAFIGNADNAHGVTVREIIEQFNDWVDADAKRTSSFSKDPSIDSVRRVLTEMNIVTFGIQRKRQNIYRIFFKSNPPPQKPPRQNGVIAKAQEVSNKAAQQQKLNKAAQQQELKKAQQKSKKAQQELPKKVVVVAAVQQEAPKKVVVVAAVQKEAPKKNKVVFKAQQVPDADIEVIPSKPKRPPQMPPRVNSGMKRALNDTSADSILQQQSSESSDTSTEDEDYEDEDEEDEEDGYIEVSDDGEYDEERSDYETTGMFVPDGHVEYETDASFNEEVHEQMTMVRPSVKRRRLHKKYQHGESFIERNAKEST